MAKTKATSKKTAPAAPKAAKSSVAKAAPARKPAPAAPKATGAVKPAKTTVKKAKAKSKAA